MKNIYIWNNDKLIFKPVKPKQYAKVILYLIIALCISFIAGTMLTKYTIKHNINIIDSQELTINETDEDQTFIEYKLRANIYLNKFNNTPIEANMLTLAAYNTYNSTGILLPVELALAQAQLESSMGTKGRSPINNPYNLGEYDTSTIIKFTNTFDGIQAYYYIIAKNYLKCKSIEHLLNTFTNCNGKRYANSPTYEEVLKKQIKYIKNYIDNEIKKQKKTN
jgi:hypothetical protein